MRVNELHQLVFRLQVLVGHLAQTLAHAGHLLLADGVEHLLLALEVGVERPAPFARGNGDVVHRGVIDAVLGKKLPSNVNQLFSCLQ